MEELQKISTEMAELLRQKNSGGFAGQVVTREGIVVNRSLSFSNDSSSMINNTTTEDIPATSSTPAESGVTNVTSTSSSYVVKSIPRTGGHW